MTLRVQVLIAEDETTSDSICGRCSMQGIDVCGEARDGVEAVEASRARPQPDLAVLDLKMPRLDGVEAARRIYAERPLPIIMLTAYADP